MLGVIGLLRATLVASTGTTVAVLVALLVALGAVMVAVAVWLVRSTRGDHPALAPLETMGDRSFRRASTDRRATRLSEARPPGAPPPAPIVPLDDEPEDAEAPEESAESEEPSEESEEPSGELAEPSAADQPAGEKCEPSQQDSAPTAHTSATEQQPDAP